MHDSTQYDPTKVKVKVTEIRSFSKTITFPIYIGGWQMTTDFKIRTQYLQLIRAGFFFIFVLVFVSHDFEVGSK